MSFRDTGFRSAHTSVRSTLSSLRSRAFADCDQVYPGLYVGDAISAKDKNFLREMRINYVLNTAEGKHSTQVDTSQFYYRDCIPSIKYKGFQMLDMPYTNISKYFYIAADFIDEAISGGGRVLVHCMAGVSRSATCAIAYLMIKKEMSLAEAMATINNRRSIHPNEGFVHQLQELDRDLRTSRSYRLDRLKRTLYTRDPYAY